MIKGQASSEQFQSRSGSHATKGSRKGYSILGGGEDPVSVLSAEELRDSLKQKLISVEAKLLALKGTEERKQVVAEKMEIAAKLAELRIKKKLEKPEAVPHVFVNLCREQMTKYQFQKLISEASEIVRINEEHNRRLYLDAADKGDRS